MIHFRSLAFGLLFGLTLLTSDALAHEVAKEMHDAANKFLKSLDDSQREAISFKFDDPLRLDWQFIPMERKGLGLKAMKPHQRGLAMCLVQSALSHRGFATSMEIMALEQILSELENDPVKRDPTKYHLFLFGQPKLDGTWGWRIEGHHLSISVTITQSEDGQVVETNPSFFGSNPAEIRSGPMKGARVLGDLEDAGRKLVKQLSVEQKATAVLEGKAPRDVINGPNQSQAKTLMPAGIAASELDATCQKMLKELLTLYLDKFRSELVEADRKQLLGDGFEEIKFAWIGPIQKGKPHYFRVQGKTFVLEYDNTQNKANHVHVVWRDLTNDFGKADLNESGLKQHYENSHSKR